MSVNLNATLAKAEQEALRLQQQAEQEAAMAVALPLRFAQNMAAFRRYIPHIADMYEAYQPARRSNYSALKMVNPIWRGSMMMLPFTGPTLPHMRDPGDRVHGEGTLSKFSFSQEANPWALCMSSTSTS